MPSDRRSLVLVVAAVIALVAVLVLIPRGTSPGEPGASGPFPTCPGDIDRETPSASCPAEASSSAGPSDEPSASTGASDEPSQEPVALTVGLGFIPSVQFAPFYLADQAGYYAEAGLDVEFQNKIDPDLVTLVGQGSIDVGLADGTSVIPAVSQGIPIKYVATIYGQFPSIVFAKASTGIRTAADLAGQEGRDPGAIRVVVDHAPGAARRRRPHARGRRDRRVPGLRPGCGRVPGRGRLPRPGSRTTSPSSWS